MKLRFLAIALLISFAPAFAIAAAAAGSPTLEFAAHSHELTSSLQYASQIKLMKASDLPSPLRAGMNELLASIQSTTSGLMTPEEASRIGDLSIFLYEGHEPGALSFLTGDGQKALIGINTGMLRMIQNEDEAAFVLSSEIERLLHDRQEKRYGLGDLKNREFYRLKEASALDVPALKRLNRHGRSIQAPIDFAKRAEQLSKSSSFGSDLAWDNRLTTLANTKAALFRDGQVDEKFRLGGVSQEKHGFSRAKIRLYQGLSFDKWEGSRVARRLENRFQGLRGAATPYFQWAKDRSEGKNTPYPTAGTDYAHQTENGFNALARTRWLEIERDAGNFMTSLQQKRLKLRLNRELLDEFNRARSEVFGPQFTLRTAGGSANLELIESLMVVEPESLWYPGGMGIEEETNAWIELKSRIADGKVKPDEATRSEARILKELNRLLELMEPRMTAEAYLAAHARSGGGYFHADRFGSIEVQQQLAKIGLRPVELRRSFEEVVSAHRGLQDSAYALRIKKGGDLSTVISLVTDTRFVAQPQPVRAALLNQGWEKLRLAIAAAPVGMTFRQGTPILEFTAEMRALRQHSTLAPEAYLKSVLVWFEKAIEDSTGLADLRQREEILDHFDIELNWRKHRPTIEKKISTKRQTFKAAETEKLVKALDDIAASNTREVKSWNVSLGKQIDKLLEIKKKVDVAVAEGALDIPRFRAAFENQLFELLRTYKTELRPESIRAITWMNLPQLLPQGPDNSTFFEDLRSLLREPKLKEIKDNLFSAGHLDAALLSERSPSQWIPESARGLDSNLYWGNENISKVLPHWESRVKKVADIFDEFGLAIPVGGRSGESYALLHGLHQELKSRNKGGLTLFYAYKPEIASADFRAFLTENFQQRTQAARDPAQGVESFFAWLHENNIATPTEKESSTHLNEVLETFVSKTTDPLSNKSSLSLEAYDLLRAGEEAFVRKHKPDAKQSNYLLSLKGSAIALLRDEDALEQISPDLIARVARREVDLGESLSETDELYRRLKPIRDSHPDARALLLRSDFFAAMDHPSDSLELARWQIQQAPGFAQEAARLKGRNITSYPKKEEVRPELKAVLEKLKTLFNDGASLESNEIVDFIEKKLVTSPAEVALLTPYRLSFAKAGESKSKLKSDLVGLASMFLEDPKERLDLISFLVGHTDKPPTLEAIHFLMDKVDLKRHRSQNFASRPLLERAFMLQKLLGQDGKIIDAPENRLFVKEMILGENTNHKVISALYDEFMDTLPADERPLLLSMALAQYDPKSKAAGTLRSLGEISGPLGGKGTQKLVVSGILPPEERMKLMHSFDDFLPPNREEIVEQLKRIFGEAYVDIESIGPMVGSGSVNWVAAIVVKDPASGNLTKLTVRVQKDRVPEKVANERRIWTEVARRLRDPKYDPEIRRTGRILHNIVDDTYQSLQAGGVELDMSLDRRNHADASRAYASSKPHPRTGYRVEVLGESKAWQDKVQPDHGSRVLVSEYIPNTSLHDLPDPVLKRRLAEQIIEIEMSALKDRWIDVKGSPHRAFDPDWHFRNWLIDTDNQRLVRIDYSQLERVGRGESDRMRKLVYHLLDGMPGSDDRLRKFIVANAREIFELKEVPADFERVLSQVLASPGVPQAPEFLERLIHIQNELEGAYAAIGQELNFEFKPHIRSQLSSLFKLNLYKEFVDEKFLLSKVAEFTGMSRMRAFAPVVSQKAVSALHSLRDELLKKARSSRAVKCVGDRLGQVIRSK